MSASSKKKLRKEQQAAAMTERQQQERKEAKKLKRNTIIFVTVIGLVLLAFVGILVYQWITSNGIFEKATTAATVNGTEINSVEMNYYYVDTALEQADQLYSYASYFGGDLSVMGLDTSTPLNEQEYYDGQTWADYIMELALENAQHDYALAAAAKKAGYTLSDEDQETLNTYSKNMDANAKALGYESADQLLAQQYGHGAEKDTYLAYLKRGMIASGYYNEYSDSLSFDETAIRERDELNPMNYNSYDYAYYYVSYSDYLEGGTENDEGEVEYSADEENAARAKAKEIADQLATATSLEELEAAVAELEVDGETGETVTHSHKTLYTSVIAAHQEWIAAEERQEGDITVIENKSSTTEDDEEALINGYYVVCYESMSTNDLSKMSGVRHLLIEFETEEDTEEETEEEPEDTDETVEESSEPTEETVDPTAETEELIEETTEPTEEPTEEVIEPTETEGEGEEETESESETEESVSEAVRQAALAEAERLLAEWQAGDATEDSFAELVADYTDDTASAETGGLYENIHAGSDYVEAFLAWAIDPARQVGDVEIVETEYGYHIMYFVGWEDLTYRDQLILDELKTEAFDTWYNGLIEAKPAKKGNTKYVLKEMLLSDFGY